jgi:hypothetical protein
VDTKEWPGGRKKAIIHVGPFERYRGEATMSSRFEVQLQDYGMDPACNS